MKTRRIRVTAKKADELAALFRSLPPEPVGDHLSDDEFVGYATETLTTEEVHQIEEHLASCPDCATETERLLEASKVWQGEQGKQRLAAVRQRIFGVSTLWGRLRAFLEPFSYRLALEREFFAPGEPLDVESADAAFGLFLVEEDNGDVTVRTDSSEVELGGVRIRFSAGEWQRVVRLDKVAEDRVGAEVVITRKEREALPPNTLLRAEPVSEEDESLHTGE